MIKNNNILFLLHLPPPVHGASLVGKYIKDSKVINDTFKSRYINLLISRTVDESGKTKILKLMRYIGLWFKLLYELIKQRPDLCYFALTVNGAGFYKDVALVFLIKLFRVKIIYHHHSKGVKRNESNKINHLLYKYIFNNSNVILLSQFLYEDVKTFVTEEQVYICPNGVEDIIDDNNFERENKSQPVKILFLSNLIKSKGVYILIDACEILLQRGCDFLCVFVGGEGDVTEKLFNHEVEKRNMTESVKYLGKKYGQEKNEVYKTTDVFVLPTFYSNECFPLVLLEAMQYRLPVVSTIEGGIRDIVKDEVTGFLVDRKNAVALANKLELLIKNESLRLKMGRAGRAKYENEFTLQAFEFKLQEILETVLFA